MILRPGTLEIEFLPSTNVNARIFIASCCVRVVDVDALHRAFTGPRYDVEVLHGSRRIGHKED